MGTEDKEPVCDKFPKDFFDLIVIDECHQGSAAEDSAWRGSTPVDDARRRRPY